MTPADIAASAEFRAGLARRLAEVGLVPPDAATPHLIALHDTQAASAGDERKAA